MTTADDRHPVEALSEEFVARHRAGETPSVEEYAAAHPEFADEIRALFPTALAMEDWRHDRVSETSTGSRIVAFTPPERLGDFRLIREVGRGGMGVVFEAKQESLDRRVALKILPAALDSRALERFDREARTAASLVHAHIVPVYGVGAQDGLHYYVMQLIDGVGLDEVSKHRRNQEPWRDDDSDPRLIDAVAWLEQGRSPWHRLGELGCQVADALAYAHSRSVRHRDIKPANLLLDRDGICWVTDFGIARALERDDVTGSGHVSGTLQYMAPEQIDGRDDERSDIYGLGLSLYELATRRRPFEARRASELMRKIQTETPTPIRKLVPTVPRDFETIVMKAMAPAPEQRYTRAAEFRDDLVRFLDDRPVQARRIGHAERLIRWCKRNRAVASLAAAVLVATVAAIFFGWRSYLVSQRNLAEEQKRKIAAQIATARAEDNVDLALRAFDGIIDRIGGRDPLRVFESANEDATEVVAAVAGDVTEVQTVSAEDAALLQQMLEFYEQFAVENDDHPRLAAETARAYRRVGDIHRRLRQRDSAEAAYRRALELMQDSQTTADAIECAAAWVGLGQLRNRRRRWREPPERRREQPDDYYRRALRILEPHDADRRVRRQLVSVHDLFAEMELRRSRRRGARGGRAASEDREAHLAVAREHYAKTLDYAERLVDVAAPNADDVHLLARTLRRSARVRPLPGHDETTADTLRRAESLLVELTTRHPNTTRYRYELVHVYRERRPASSGNTDDDALVRYEKAREQVDRLVDQEPGDLRYRVSQVHVLGNLARLYDRRNHINDADATHREAVTAAQGLDLESSRESRFLYVYTRVRWTRFLRDQDRRLEATNHLDTWIDETVTQLETRPKDFASLSALSTFYGELAKTLEELDQTALAEEAKRKAHDAADRAKENRPRGHRGRRRGPPRDRDGRRPRRP